MLLGARAQRALGELVHVEGIRVVKVREGEEGGRVPLTLGVVLHPGGEVVVEALVGRVDGPVGEGRLVELVDEARDGVHLRAAFVVEAQRPWERLRELWLVY